MIEKLATICFGLALVHTIIAPWLGSFRSRFRKNSPAEKLLHLLSEIEVIFGFWCAIFLFWWAVAIQVGISNDQIDAPIHFLEGVNYTESIFVFVIMTISSARPLLAAATRLMRGLSKFLFFSQARNLTIVILILGPLMGSLMTEPASMTVCCYLLLPIIRSPKVGRTARYLLLGLLFVNISIGGTLTNFAAPPVLVVAGRWGWDTHFMLSHFGWRAALAVVISTIIITTLIRKQLDAVSLEPMRIEKIPFWIVTLDMAFIALSVLASHHVVLLFAIFLFYLGFSTVTNEIRDELKLRESLLVGFFLAGLVTLGSLQEWWIRPLLSSLGSLELFGSATALTAITDNALLTYLGTLVPEFSDEQKYSLVSGAVCGGGLTVIANAPNPIGYALLDSAFEGRISTVWLFIGALIPTTVAALLFLV